MEAILYNISKNITMISIFLILILILGIIIYLITKKFDIHKKSIRYCGLLSRLNNRQILILSILLIRCFTIIYATCIYSQNILTELTIILLTSLLYIILVPRKILFESINIVPQAIIVYFINVLQNYKIEISSEMYIGQVIITLQIIIIIYAIYFLLKNFEELIGERGKKDERQKIGKRKKTNPKHAQYN